MGKFNFSKNKIIIFDFDGTIANSFWMVMKTFNKLCDKFSSTPLDSKMIYELRNMTSEDILFKKFKIKKWKLLFITRKIKKIMAKKVCLIKPINGISFVIKSLKRNGFYLGIISSNSKSNIKKFLEINDLDYFDFIYETSILGKSSMFNKIIKKQKIDSQNIIYIGDETRDVSAARKSNVIIISVTWGYNSKNILKKQMPDYLIDTPKELLRILNNL